MHIKNFVCFELLSVKRTLFLLRGREGEHRKRKMFNVAFYLIYFFPLKSCNFL